jgi:hypothetical protein
MNLSTKTQIFWNYHMSLFSLSHLQSDDSLILVYSNSILVVIVPIRSKGPKYHVASEHQGVLILFHIGHY